MQFLPFLMSFFQVIFLAEKFIHTTFGRSQLWRISRSWVFRISNNSKDFQLDPTFCFPSTAVYNLKDSKLHPDSQVQPENTQPKTKRRNSCQRAILGSILYSFRGRFFLKYTCKQNHTKSKWLKQKNHFPNMLQHFNQHRGTFEVWTKQNGNFPALFALPPPSKLLMKT